MSEENVEIRFLVADPTKGVYSSIKRGYNESGGKGDSSSPKPVHVESFREAQSFLSNREVPYAGVIVNPDLGNPQWVSVIKNAQHFRPGVPIIVVFDTPPNMKPEDLKKLGAKKFLKKPVTYQQILEIAIGKVEEAPAELELEAPAIEDPETHKKTKDGTATDADFVTVNLNGIIGNLKSQFDLYVKLPTGKYIQVSKAGDYLSAERIASYKAKGADNLYITTQAQTNYMKFVDEMVASMLKDTSVSFEQKTGAVADQGQRMADYLRTSGFSEESMEEAQKYVANMTEMITQVSVKSDAVKTWMNNVAAMEHSVSSSTIAGLMMKNIGVGNASIISAIGVACFLHDIGLADAPPHMLDEDPSTMSEEEKKVFYEHADKSSKMLKKMKGVPPIVAEAVMEHHYRMNVTWGTQSKPHSAIHLIAEVVGIAEEFSRLIKKQALDPKINAVDELKKTAHQQFSKRIAAAFIKTVDQK
jgi:putative nucleotidyltransferase with HDIG domain